GSGWARCRPDVGRADDGRRAARGQDYDRDGEKGVQGLSRMVVHTLCFLAAGLAARLLWGQARTICQIALPTAPRCARPTRPKASRASGAPAVATARRRLSPAVPGGALG